MGTSDNTLESVFLIKAALKHILILVMKPVTVYNVCYASCDEKVHRELIPWQLPKRTALYEMFWHL